MTDWHAPYTIKSYGIWPIRKHVVIFDGTPVVFSSLDRDLVEIVVAGLNGAYNLGRASIINHPSHST